MAWPAREPATSGYTRNSVDACARELRAYRLAGPLEPIVCGVHHDPGYRLAFTMQLPETVGQPTRVVILYVGLREPNHRQSDIWTILQDLFGVQNPPVDHDRPPCCEGSVPEIDKEDLDAFLRDLQRMTRGRSSSRRPRSGA